MLLSYVRKDSFTKAWTREFSLLSCSLMANVFCKEIWKELGQGYTKIIFIKKGNQISCYKIKKEDILFSKYYGEKVKSEKKYARTISNRLIKLSNKFLLFVKKNKRIFSENYRKFLKLYNKFLSYHMAVYWAADYLKDDQKYKKEFKILRKAWTYNEKVYIKVDFFMNKTLDNFTKINKNNLEKLVFKDFFVFLQKNRLPKRKLNRNYSNLSALICFRDKQDLYLGKKVTEIENMLQDSISKKKIVGISIFKTFKNIRGRVKVINNVNNLPEFKSGYILVTPMTRPQFNHFFKKSKAIITDEGGTLCHAAILGREFKIPCIIGTKIATQVLKDGDLVEMDTNKGVVRILKR